MIRKIARYRQEAPWPWNHLARPMARESAPIDEVIGHNLSSTRWKGCRTIYDF